MNAPPGSPLPCPPPLRPPARWRPTLTALAATGATLAASLLVPASAHAGVAPSTVRLVAGTAPVTDGAGAVWSPDGAYTLGGRLSWSARPIAGTADDALFHTERYGAAGYRIPVAPGTYTLTLDMAEHYWARGGQRVFDVAAEGRPLATSVDAAAAVGPFRAYQRAWTVTVTDGTLDVAFRNRVDLASVTSLSVVPVAAPGSGAPVPPPPPAGPTPPPAAAGTTPEQYGARGDGRTDDTAALQRAFDAARPGAPVVLAAGRTYAHAAVLHLRVAGMHVTGGGTLLATREATSSVWIEADSVLVDGALTLRTASTTTRWSAWEQMGLRLSGHDGITVRGLTVSGAAAAGIYVGGSSHYVLDHVTVQDSRADGIHQTEGAHDGQVLSPTVVRSGDDGVAVVSYAQDGAPCHDITVTSPRVLGTTWGRGLSVVGGSRVLETDVDVEGSNAAGIYLGVEGAPWFTTAVSDVVVRGGSVVGANTNPQVDHGAVLVLTGQQGVTASTVTVTGLTITGTRPSASRDIGVVNYGTAPSGVVFSDLTIVGGPRSAYSGNTAQGAFELRSITQNGVRLRDAG